MYSNIIRMAWGEPGGNNKNRKNDGPPDLDEILKNLLQKVSDLFPGSKNPRGANVLAFILIIAALLGYLLTGFYTVYPYEQAVITRFGKYHSSTTSGLHWHPRFIDKVHKVKTESLRSSKHSGWMLTKDENILMVEIEVQYRVIDAEKYLFNAARPDDTLREAADSALRQVIGDSMTDDVLTNKKMQIADGIKEKLINTLDMYDMGFFIQNVNYKDSRPPEEVKDSFDDVTKSREDRERLKLQADAFTNNILPEAEGKAKKMLLEAESYKQEVILHATAEAAKFDLIFPEYAKAPKVTKHRMYIRAMEEIMVKTPKVLVDVDKGNNVIYLPLDKVLSNNRAAKKLQSNDKLLNDHKLAKSGQPKNE